MSYVNLGTDSFNRCLILDTDDLAVDAVYRYNLERYKRQGFVIEPFNTENTYLGIRTRDNMFALYVLGNDTIIYRSGFNINTKLTVVRHDISIAKIGRFNNCILVAVIDCCYVNFDFEIPMTMLEIVSIPLINIKMGARRALYTSRPIYIAETNIARLQKQKYKLFPNEVLDTSLDNIVLYNKLKVYGAEFKSLIENQDLLNFIRLESI